MTVLRSVSKDLIAPDLEAAIEVEESHWRVTIATGLMPALVVLLFGILTDRNLPLIMFTMHSIAMFGSGLIVANRRKQSLRELVTDCIGWHRIDLTSKVSIACFFACAGLVSVLIGDLIFNRLVGDSLSKTLQELGVTGMSLSFKVLWGLYFVTVNPVIEEFFWRGLLGSLLRRGLQSAQSPNMSENVFQRSRALFHSDSNLVLARQNLYQSRNMQTHSEENEESPSGNDNRQITQNTCFSLKERLALSSLYGSYHFVVIGVLIDGIIGAFIGFCLVMALGMLLLRLAYSNETGGWALAVATHFGVDLGVAIAIGVSLMS